MANLIEKSKQLYIDCDNCNPNQSTLMCYRAFEDKNMYWVLALSLMVNKYACKNENDSEWLLQNEIINPSINHDKKAVNRVFYRLVKKGILEMKEENNIKFYRLTDKTSGLFNIENYRSTQLV